MLKRLGIDQFASGLLDERTDPLERPRANRKGSLSSNDGTHETL